jgi:hypothetical protein
MGMAIRFGPHRQFACVDDPDSPSCLIRFSSMVSSSLFDFQNILLNVALIALVGGQVVSQHHQLPLDGLFISACIGSASFSVIGGILFRVSNAGLVFRNDLFKLRFSFLEPLSTVCSAVQPVACPRCPAVALDRVAALSESGWNNGLPVRPERWPQAAGR